MADEAPAPPPLHIPSPEEALAYVEWAERRLAELRLEKEEIRLTISDIVDQVAAAKKLIPKTMKGKKAETVEAPAFAEPDEEEPQPDEVEKTKSGMRL